MEAMDWRETDLPAKRYDHNAVGIYPDNENKLLVGHAPSELPFLLCKFIARKGCYLEFTPTGGRFLKDGLVVTGIYSAYPKGKALFTILKNELDKKRT